MLYICIWIIDPTKGLLHHIKDEEQEVEGLIMPVNDEDADSGSQQQSVYQPLMATGPYEPEQLVETEICLS